MDSEFHISIDTVSGHPREERTVAELQQLLHDYDLSGLQWTDRVVVEFKAGAHSHPVLTLNTLHTGVRLLSTYVHEQMHWWVADHPGTTPAIADSKSMWPAVPSAEDGGAQTEFSTRLHLIVCHLEHRAMEQLLGDDCADLLLKVQIHGVPSYPWIRIQVGNHGSLLDGMSSAHDLWPGRLRPVR